MPVVTIRPIDRENWREALTLAVQPSQQPFVAEYEPIVLIGLAKAYVGSLGLIWLPYAIYADDLMVGFVAVAYGPESQHQYWIYHFFIDQGHQGKGFGKLALSVLIERIKTQFPNCHRINLTVHPENVTAQHLYTRAGFTATGETAYDEPLYQLQF